MAKVRKFRLAGGQARLKDGQGRRIKYVKGDVVASTKPLDEIFKNSWVEVPLETKTTKGVLDDKPKEKEAIGDTVDSEPVVEKKPKAVVEETEDEEEEIEEDEGDMSDDDEAPADEVEEKPKKKMKIVKKTRK